MAKRSRRSAAGAGGQPAATRPQSRAANREANRALARAGTRGSGRLGTGSLFLWSSVFGIVAVVIVAAAIIISQSSPSVAGAPAAPGVVTPASIPTNGRTLGQANAPVTIDLYGDFRCSACLAFTTQGTEKSIVDNYIATGKAKLVWHDLLSIDAKDGATASRDAANAAWCAADQGKFWTMHDWLYANQSPTEAASAFTLPRLMDIARSAGLDTTQFGTCLNGGTHNAAIATEQTNTPSEAAGTPSVFVAGKFVGVPGANLIPTYSQISAAIDAALAGAPSPS